MALHTGLAVNSISIDAPDVRLGQAGLVVRDVNGAPRSGIFPNHTNAIVTARADMKVDVAAFAAAFSRGAGYGVVLFANDGSTQVTLDAAPTANSRIDLIYVAVPDSTAGDAAATPSFKVVKGAASATPAKPALPTGGLEIGTVQIPSTATTTQSANVVITQTFQYTAAMGGRVYFRTTGEMTAAVALFGPGVEAYAIDTSTPWRKTGGAWTRVSPLVMNFENSGAANPTDGSGFVTVTHGQGVNPTAVPEPILIQGNTTAIFGIATLVFWDNPTVNTTRYRVRREDTHDFFSGSQAVFFRATLIFA